MPHSAFVPLALFMALLAAVALFGLAASGHLPLAQRGPALRSRAGAAILVGTAAIAALAFGLGLAQVWRPVPVPALVIAGGLAVLAAPLVLRALPDWFVDGQGALLAFAGTAAMLALALVVWA